MAQYWLSLTEFSIHSLNAPPKDYGTNSLLLDALPDSILGKILRNNMDQLSFADKDVSVQRTLTSNYHAYIDDLNLFLPNKKRCQMKLLFTIPGNSIGFAYKKNWPYGKFLSHALLLIKDSGRYHKFKDQHTFGDSDCSPVSETGSISMKKVISSFAFYLIGLVLSMCACLAEKLLNKERKD